MTNELDRSEIPAPRPSQSGRSGALALLALVAAAGITALPAEESSSAPLSPLATGPLRIAETFFPAIGFLAVEPARAEVLEPARFEIDFVASAANSWGASDAVEDVLDERQRRLALSLAELRLIDEERSIYYADGELYLSSLALRRGIGRGLELELDVSLVNVAGGVLDGAAETFHDAAGFEQDGRDGIPRGRYAFYFRDDEGREVFREDDTRPGLGDVVLAVKHGLPFAPGEWKLAWRGRLKLPTGDAERLYSSGSADVGLQALGSRCSARACLHASAGLARLGPADDLGLDAQLQLSGTVSYEHAFGRTFSALGQAAVLQNPLGDLSAEGLDELAWVVDVGAKKVFGPDLVVFLALSESLQGFRDAPTLGVHAGLSREF